MVPPFLSPSFLTPSALPPTVHSLRRNKKKKVETEKEASAALIEELTEEEYRSLTQQEQKE